jgi:cell wall-associated NlpC family hydrolase
MGSSRLLSALALGVACGVLPLAPAQADIDQQIQQAQAELSQLQQQAAAAAEQVNEATLQWQEAQQAVADKQAEVSATQQTLTSTQASLDQVVSQIYRSGGVEPTLLVLASEEPSNWLATLDAARIIASTQNQVLVRNQVTEQQLLRDQAALEKAEKRADRARNEILDAKAAIDSRVAESTAVLSQLQVEQQRILAEQLARQQAEQQKQAENAADQVAALPESTTKPVVEYAIKQVGKKFEQGATGPDAFDASGLTKAAWELAGVTLPHSVQRQFDRTQRIDITGLQAGDLVFLYATDEHVGIYTGDGYFVHAKSPREGVVYEKLFTNEYMSQFAGAGRPKV